MSTKRRPGEVRDAIIEVLMAQQGGATAVQVQNGVAARIGNVAPSSIRSYLQLNTPGLFLRSDRGQYLLDEGFLQPPASRPAARSVRKPFEYGKSLLVQADCMDWLRSQQPNTIHAVVTDPPYGLQEYSEEQQEKLRSGKGGVWRIPPAFDGVKRSPLPRFTVLTKAELKELEDFFYLWARALVPVLVPGANVVMASNPLLSHIVSGALARAGLERRGELIRLVMTMRGGDRPKDAHEEFDEVSVMPRSMWEPWLLFRRPIDGRVQDNLRKWMTGGFRRPGSDKPFGDVIASSPTRAAERDIAPHPSLKPQAFLRKLVRGVLPLGKGIVLDSFAGAGSTLAAAEAIGYASIGVEKDPRYFDVARSALPKLATLAVKEDNGA
jgi:DNA modification methylase